jgi:hypothetical protein
MRRLPVDWRTTGGLCLLLAIIHTWPLASNPGTLSRNDNGDAQLNEWVMAWIAHQLPREPSRLFDGNIFYPAKKTLAYSEPIIVPALMGAPLRWLGGSPVLVFNIVLIIGFALTAWAGYALVYEWTGDRAAGFLAGSMFAFNSHTLTRLAHIQGIHAWGLPLALLSADRLVVHARWRDAIWLAVWMTAMAYTSGYLVVFATFIIGIVLITRLQDWWPHASVVILRFAAATVITIVAVLPVYLPYRQLAIEMHMLRSLDVVKAFSATPQGYLATVGRFHYAVWSERFLKNPVDTFFPGVIVIALALLAVYWGFRRTSREPADRAPSRPDRILTRRRIVMLIAMVVIGFVLSLGTATPVYGWLYHSFPPMQGLRAAARFGNLFLLGMAALAGFGLAAVRTRLPQARAGLVVIALVVFANLESLRAPLGYTRFEGIPSIYSLLAHEPGPVVLVEVPFYPAHAAFQNAPYVLNSTAHWRPLMNGYSGYTPNSYRQYAALFWYFPEDHAIEAMRKAGATHVLVHPQGFGNQVEEMWRKVGANPHLQRFAIGPNGLVLYHLR